MSPRATTNSLRTTKLHPVAILLGLTVFGTLFGIVGMLMATPTLAMGKAIINYYNDNAKVGKGKHSGIDVNDVDRRHPLIDVVCEPVLTLVDRRVSRMRVPGCQKSHYL